MGRRRRERVYRAVRVDEQRWQLLVEGKTHSSHRGYRGAERAAAVDDRQRRTRLAAVRHLAILAAALLILTPAMLFREVANPDFGPARAFADQMEQAYRAIHGGTAGVLDISPAEDGFSGDFVEITRGGVVADYLVLTGEHRGDCYLVRGTADGVPFVARLLPRYPCEPEDRALSFHPADFEAIAVNLEETGPLQWEPVLPSEVKLATWFYPAVFVLGFVVMQQLVSVSLLMIRGVPARKPMVERIEDQPEQA